jgi:arylsulfatase A-like enzyme/thioredoxin-like negative regulator of GroEL
MRQATYRRVFFAGVVLLALAGVVALVMLRPVFHLRSVDLSGLRGANMLLVTLDTTRADHVGCYGYAGAETPALDALARDGVVFEQCITPTAFTLPSHSSIMTGMYPPFHGVRVNGGAALADVHSTLAERLAAGGYRCGAFVGAFVLDGRWGLGQGFDHYDDEFEIGPDQRLDLVSVQRPADQVVDAAVDWLATESDQPFFTWVHLYDPHTPYEPPEPYRSRFEHGGLRTLYDGEIAFADSQVGRLLDWMDTRGLAGDTIVVVVGDHGEGLGSHGESYHGYYIYDYAVRVPLLIRLPISGFAGVRVSAQVRTIDLLPTVLDLLGVQLPEPVHGESLVGLMVDPEAEGPGPAYSESMATSLQFGWSALYGVRTAEYKFIDAPRSELYDLKLDPDESVNLLGDRKGIADELVAELNRIRKWAEQGAPDTQEADLDEQTLAMLAALGYAGGATQAAEGEDLADPKDMIHLYQSIGYSAHLMNEQDFAGAVELLEAALGEDPDIPQAQFLLSTCYRKAGRTSDAKAVLDRYLRQNPDSTPALIIMAGILSEEGNTDEVLALSRRVLAVDERNTQAYELMAGVYMGVNDHRSALPLLRKVVEIQPKLTRSRNNLAACLVGLGEFDDARALLDNIIAEHPRFPLAHYHLGLLDEEQGRLEEARAAYETEVELYPSSVVARFNLGNLLMRRGDLEGAAEQMQTLIQQAPEHARAYLLLARILLAEGADPYEVERLARQGLERTEAADLKALGYFLLADAYSRQGRKGEVEKAVEAAQRYQAQIE